MANSRLRPVARIRSKLATFAQAINSTRLTAPSITSNDLRASPTILSRSGSTANAAGRSKKKRVAAAELIGHNLQQRVGLGQGHAGFEAGGGNEVVTLIGAVEIELKGKQDVASGSETKDFPSTPTTV